MKKLEPLLGLLWLILFLWACDVVEVDPVSPNNNFDDPVTEDAEVVDIGSGTIPQDPVQFATFLHNNSSKVWVAEQFTIAGLSAFQQCRLDDSMVLSSDGTYQYDGGDQLCGAEDDASAKVGAWEFNAENAVMTQSTIKLSLHLENMSWETEQKMHDHPLRGLKNTSGPKSG